MKQTVGFILLINGIKLAHKLQSGNLWNYKCHSHHNTDLHSNTTRAAYCILTIAVISTAGAHFHRRAHICQRSHTGPHIWSDIYIYIQWQ
jgi:hypothetical protein